MKYVIIAGEASGDLHAAHLMEALKVKDPDATFVFFGGDKMKRVAGHDPVVHINDMAFMGFSEVLRHLGAIRRNLKLAHGAVRGVGVDALILIDYPSFNLKVARTAKKAGVPVFYYISPKVWAWKEYRVKQIKRLVDHMYVIFPFEVSYYRSRHEYEVTFVGNPSVSEVDNALANMQSREDFLSAHSLRDRPLLALLPGSRVGEIRNNLSVMTQVSERLPQYRAVIAGAPGVSLDVYRRFTDLPVVYDSTLTLLAYSRASLVTSGTATLEAALVGTPQVACYRSNGSKMAYKIMKRILKVPFVTLPNLIADKEIIPEMLLHRCTPDLIGERLFPLLSDTPERRAMIKGYAEVRERLSAPGDAPTNAAADILARL